MTSTTASTTTYRYSSDAFELQLKALRTRSQPEPQALAHALDTLYAAAAAAEGVEDAAYLVDAAAKAVHQMTGVPVHPYWNRRQDARDAQNIARNALTLVYGDGWDLPTPTEIAAARRDAPRFGTASECSCCGQNPRRCGCQD